jgi:hypothetical protein
MERDIEDALENADKANAQRIATGNAEYLYAYYTELQRVGFTEKQALYFINRTHDAWLASRYPVPPKPQES